MKKSNHIMLIMGCCIVSLFFACSPTEEQPKESCSTRTSSINPNGDSELALLMRQLRLDADTLKQLITTKEGNISDEFITKLEDIHNAIPTDEKVKTPEFTAYSDLMISQAKALQNASNENKEKEFNKLVTSCVNCHVSFCPGPVETIKKLNIVNPI